MNKLTINVVIGVAIALMIAGASSYLTYVVDDHFDYVRQLEEDLNVCEGDKADLEQHNLGLLNQVNEPSSK